MIIDVPRVPQGHSVQSQDLEPFADDLPATTGKISCTAEIDRSAATLYVHLRFQGTFNLECSRCLTLFAFPIEGELRLVIKEDPAKFGPALDDDSADFLYNSRHGDVDLNPAIYDEIMTAVPMKPLCTEECKGIVPKTAGVAIVDETTPAATIDPRWEALKKLKK